MPPDRSPPCRRLELDGVVRLALLSRDAAALCRRVSHNTTTQAKIRQFLIFDIKTDFLSGTEGVDDDGLPQRYVHLVDDTDTEMLVDGLLVLMRHRQHFSQLVTKDPTHALSLEWHREILNLHPDHEGVKAYVRRVPLFLKRWYMSIHTQHVLIWRCNNVPHVD